MRWILKLYSLVCYLQSYSSNSIRFPLRIKKIKRTINKTYGKGVFGIVVLHTVLIYIVKLDIFNSNTIELVFWNFVIKVDVISFLFDLYCLNVQILNITILRQPLSLLLTSFFIISLLCIHTSICKKRKQVL